MDYIPIVGVSIVSHDTGATLNQLRENLQRMRSQMSLKELAQFTNLLTDLSKFDLRVVMSGKWHPGTAGSGGSGNVHFFIQIYFFGDDQFVPDPNAPTTDTNPNHVAVSKGMAPPNFHSIYVNAQDMHANPGMYGEANGDNFRLNLGLFAAGAAGVGALQSAGNLPNGPLPTNLQQPIACFVTAVKELGDKTDIKASTRFMSVHHWEDQSYGDLPMNQAMVEISELRAKLMAHDRNNG